MLVLGTGVLKSLWPASDIGVSALLPVGVAVLLLVGVVTLFPRERAGRDDTYITHYYTKTMKEQREHVQHTREESE